MTADRTAWTRLRRGLAARIRPAAPGPDPAPGAAGAPLQRPLVSVVVPMYQVESWLAECLDSVLAQTYTHLEVLLVDDGSTDGTAEIAQAYVDQDPRFRMVRQPNAGLGAARNTGIDLATGDLLTFLDSDDRVPPRAYQAMVRSLTRTGSDFVVGALDRDVGGVLQKRAWVRHLHDVPRPAITVEDYPDVLANIFAWTKMFRREFVERTSLRFPEGVLYEDQVPMTRAYLSARAFDVLTEPVYIWRKRDDGTSITQQKGAVDDLDDRLAAKREISRIVAADASPVVTRHWYVKVLRLDLLGYMRAASTAPDAYFATLSASVVELLDLAPADVFDHVELPFRVAAYLTAHGHREALKALLHDPDFVSSDVPTRSENDALYADLDALQLGVALPPDLLRLHPVDHRVMTQLTALDLTEPGRLLLSGVAVVRHLAPDRHRVDTTLTLSSPARPGLPVPVHPVHPVHLDTIPRSDPQANLFAGRRHDDHSHSAFSASIDLFDLVRRCEPARRRTTWQVGVTVCAVGVVSTQELGEALPQSGAAQAWSVLVDDALVTVRWVDDRGLRIDVHRRYVALRGVNDHDGLLLDVQLPAGDSVRGVLDGTVPVDHEVLEHPEQPEHPEHQGGHRQLVRVPAGILDERGLPVGLRVDCGWREPVPLTVVTPQDTVVDGDPAGTPVALLVDDVELRPGVVVVSGRARGLTDFQLRLTGPRASSRPVSVTAQQGRFSAILELTVTGWFGGELPLPANAYRVTADHGRVRTHARAGRVAEGVGGPPATHGWRVERTELGVLRLRREKSTEPASFAPWPQQQLVERVYEPARGGPRTETVLLECFGGSSCGDNPLAVSRLLARQRPDLDLVWSVRDLAVAVPPGARAVLRFTAEWWSLLGSARFLVNNNHFPPRFRKAPDQVYLQTWHGTPLKRIGLDMAHQENFSDSYLGLMKREAASWDYLLSPSPFCTSMLPSALGYTGEVLELGYPRNDVLVAEQDKHGSTALRDAVRRELGVPDDQRVLLYAPTWRENARHGSSYAKVLHLDARAVTRARPDVTVLVRGHANTSARASVRRGERVLDVTTFPDLAGLYLASDLLVTDYSSVFFDYALLDRPTMFLVPDLARYRDRLRGFYLDLEEIASGPLLVSTDEVLKHLDDDPADYAERRRALRERFAPHDDGRATERLVERLFG